MIKLKKIKTGYGLQNKLISCALKTSNGIHGMATYHLGSSHFWIQKIDDKNAFVKNKQKKYLVKKYFPSSPLSICEAMAFGKLESFSDLNSSHLSQFFGSGLRAKSRAPQICILSQPQ